jgi:hypothetical protein
MSGLLIVPSARLIPAELQGDFGQIPSCMIPFGGAPALQQILAGIHDSGMRAIVAGHENQGFIDEFLSHFSNGAVQSIDVGLTQSLGETIFRVLESESSLEGSLLVNFGDTILRGGPLEGDAFAFARPEELFRWTTFRLRSDGYLDEILDKGVEKGDTSDGRVFVGGFSFREASRFAACLAAALSDPPIALDPFYVAVLSYYNSAELPPAAKEVDPWIDLGHLDTYYSSRRVHAMGQRAFNAVSVDAFRSILTKRSRNEAKFADEIQWYTRIPAGLSYLAPRVFGHSLEAGQMSIDLEFYGYPPLSDIFLFSRLDLTEWQSIFNRLGKVLEDMSQHKVTSVSPSRIASSLRCMYLEKTVERLQDVLGNGLDSSLLDGPLQVNGRNCIPLRQLLRELPDILSVAGLLEAPSFSVIHGDFCLSNILFDRRSRTIRLVDPRGRFGEFDVYGDPRYDLAKLSHCFNGGYDLLVHGLFSLDSRGRGEFHLAEFMNERHHLVQGAFNRLFLSNPIVRNQVRLIESLLFLSMVPLHSDRPRSQQAFLLRGLETATRCLSDLSHSQG